MRKQTALWTTKTGDRIRICDMEDAHLLNTIRLCRRHAAQDLRAELNAAYYASSMLQGEMATFYCEQDIDRMENAHPDEWMPEIFFKLLDEAERRGLDSQ